MAELTRKQIMEQIAREKREQVGVRAAQQLEVQKQEEARLKQEKATAERLMKYIQDELNKGRDINDIIKEKNIAYYLKIAGPRGDAESQQTYKPLKDFVYQEYRKYINRPDVIRGRAARLGYDPTSPVVQQMIQRGIAKYGHTDTGRTKTIAQMSRPTPLLPERPIGPEPEPIIGIMVDRPLRRPEVRPVP